MRNVLHTISYVQLYGEAQVKRTCTRTGARTITHTRTHTCTPWVMQDLG